MNDEQFDNILRSALMDAANADYKDIWENAGDEVPYFSKKYLRKKKALMRDPFKKRKKPISILKRVAAAVFIITLTVGLLIFLPGTDADANLINTFFTEHNNHTEIDFKEMYGEIPMVDNWYPEYVPEGFELVEHEIDNDEIYMKWINGDTKLIFIAKSVHGGTSMVIDNEHCTVHQITINGQDAMLRIADDPSLYNTIIWQTADKKTIFEINSKIDYKELIKIAESVTIIEEK